MAASEMPDPTPVLLAAKRNAEQVRAILSAYGLRDLDLADHNLDAMAGDLLQRKRLAEILPILLDSISRTADPDQALNHWERLFGSVSRTALLDYLRTWPRMLDLLCSIFGNSDALAFTLIRDPMLVYWLAEEDVLSRPPTRAGLELALRESVGYLTVKETKLDALRRFRRREMLRIGVRDLLRLVTVPETTASLSDLACVLIQAAYEIIDADLRLQYGVPMHQARKGRWVETGFTVMGMGKLGGHELNYSSDVDLIYLYEAHGGETRAQNNGRVAAPAGIGISNEEYFEILARELTRVLSEPTREGHIFRVDLRLRAEGSIGQLARSLDEYRRYYTVRGQVWERLALLKAAPVAGSQAVGQAFLKMVKPFVLGAGGTLDHHQALAIVQDVRAVKDMIDAKMMDRGHAQRNVKLGIGGIREIEFFVQTIQVLAGRKVPALLDRSTLGSLKRIAGKKLFSAKERDALIAAYVFLRDVEHKLQMVHDLQTHSLPAETDELERCAVRMGYGAEDRKKAVESFQTDHQRHTELVHRTFQSLFLEPKISPIFKATLKAIGVKS
jgi:[glutamine synthetase] adenylyltransferase / [glutamine synthetase]-adenylyl-L-tyrosine phosphorylase